MQQHRDFHATPSLLSASRSTVSSRSQCRKRPQSSTNVMRPCPRRSACSLHRAWKRCRQLRAKAAHLRLAAPGTGLGAYGERAVTSAVYSDQSLPSRSRKEEVDDANPPRPADLPIDRPKRRRGWGAGAGRRPEPAARVTGSAAKQMQERKPSFFNRWTEGIPSCGEPSPSAGVAGRYLAATNADTAALNACAFSRCIRCAAFGTTTVGPKFRNLCNSS